MIALQIIDEGVLLCPFHRCGHCDSISVTGHWHTLFVPEVACEIGLYYFKPTLFGRIVVKRSFECIGHLTIPDLICIKYMTLRHLLTQKPPPLSPPSLPPSLGEHLMNAQKTLAHILCPSSSLRLLAPLLRLNPRRIQRYLYRTQASFPDEPGVLRVPDMPRALAIRSRVEGQPLIWLWILLFLCPPKDADGSQTGTKSFSDTNLLASGPNLLLLTSFQFRVLEGFVWLPRPRLCITHRQQKGQGNNFLEFSPHTVEVLNIQKDSEVRRSKINK